MCHPIFSWNAWSSGIGYNIVVVWCSLSFKYLNACRGFHLEKGSHQKQTLMGRPGEWALHKYRNCEFLTIFWVLFYSDPILQSNQHIKWSKTTMNLNSSRSIRCCSSLRFSRCVLSQTYPHLEQPRKKKKRLDAQVLYNWIWCLSTCW